MSGKNNSLKITREKLAGSNAELTSFIFRFGANVYVFSYRRDGKIRHTLIDAGDLRYRDEMFSLLKENNIDPANIERIIITHRHPDHVGLANLLAKETRARILVHPKFRSFIEDEPKPEERRWSGKFNPKLLRECEIEYLPLPADSGIQNINGLGFPHLIESIELGDGATLSILASPENKQTHSPDQLVVLYSPGGYPQPEERRNGDFRPTDDIIFSGDLWLMRGPVSDSGMNSLSRRLRFTYFRLKSLLSGKGMIWRNPREQDAAAKDALKKGFHLVRVKPGHGDEFLGSKIIPDSLMARRDILMALGYSASSKKSILKRKELAPKIAAMKAEAYASFINELTLWVKMGYSEKEIAALLVRIYEEQQGGGAIAKEDRKERRRILEATLARLQADEAVSRELRRLAEFTLSELKKIV